MKVEELLENVEVSEKQVWARKGKQVVRKYRCSGGRRNGRVVNAISSCYSPVDIKKRQTMKRTKARVGARMTRVARKTKRLNPASKRVQRLNKNAR
jgi:hypothetical protein